MTDKLPPPLLALFQPRPPLRYIPPTDRAPEDCPKSTISGVAQFLPEAQKFAEEVPYNATDSWVQRKWKQRAERKERLEKQLTEGAQSCTCHSLTSILGLKQVLIEKQMPLIRTLRLVGIPSVHCLLRGSVTRSRSQIWSASLVDLGPLKGYCPLNSFYGGNFIF